MRLAIRALAATLAVVLLVVLPFGLATSSPEPAAAQGDGCIVNVDGLLGIVVCGGEIVGSLPLPTVKVNVPGPPVPGPTRTVTVPGPRVTEFVTGPTTTVTKTAAPERVTVTEQVTVPGPTQTVTRSASPQPRPTETVTASPSVSPSETGQEAVTNDTIGPPLPVEDPILRIPDVDSIPEAIGFGLLSALLIFLLTIGGMAMGFALGRKTKENEDTTFMRSLLESAKVRH